MQVEVNGTRLWCDVDGPALVPGDARAADGRSAAWWARQLRPLPLQTRLRTANPPSAGRLPGPVGPWSRGSARSDGRDLRGLRR
jgi:hypothetical protein